MQSVCTWSCFFGACCNAAPYCWQTRMTLLRDCIALLHWEMGFEMSAKTLIIRISKHGSATRAECWWQKINAAAKTSLSKNWCGVGQQHTRFCSSSEMCDQPLSRSSGGYWPPPNQAHTGLRWLSTLPHSRLMPFAPEKCKIKSVQRNRNTGRYEYKFCSLGRLLWRHAIVALKRSTWELAACSFTDAGRREENAKDPQNKYVTTYAKKPGGISHVTYTWALKIKRL